jgi:aarF domain-containing kinase
MFYDFCQEQYRSHDICTPDTRRISDAPLLPPGVIHPATHDAMISTPVWAPLFRRAGASGAGLRSRRNCLSNNHQVVEKYTTRSPLRNYATQQQFQNTPPAISKRRTGLYILGATLVGGTAAVALSDEARYVYIAAQRTGRVVSALALNINE